MKNRLLFITLFLPYSFYPCAGQTSPPTVKPGQYRATLKTRAGELPFGLAIEPATGQAGSYTVFALNGSERLKMDPATLQNDSLLIPMALFESELIAKVNGDKLEGVWRRRRLGQPVQSLPFNAQLGVDYRFVPDNETATANLAGKWATTFDSKSGRVDTVNAVGLFNQKGNQLTGTFLTPTGDYRYLDGNVVGDSLFLSCFDGSHVYLFKARYDAATHMLTGGFWSGISGYEPWVARLDPAAELPDPAKLSYLKPNATRLNFSFPEPNGNLVSSADPRFSQKVTIVQILGSWCPNCMDETNFLSPWYRKNRQRGVELVGLAFERSAVMAESGPKIERMKQRFQIEYPVLLAGTNDKAQASRALPDLNAVLAFPTTIIIDKTGKVRHIHTGFSGPGTGQYYDQFVEEFNRLIDKLLTE